jgi:hypothetical protein
MLRGVLGSLLSGVLGGVFALTVAPTPQIPNPWIGTVLPSTCQQGQFFFLANLGMYLCTSTNTWRIAGLPPGLLVLSDSICPIGFTEISTWASRAIVATTTAAGNVGTTGGADTITPAGTVSTPTFTGSALATHAHELPMQLVSGTSSRLLAGAIFGTGTSRAAASALVPTVVTTSAAVALSQAVGAGTPAGTVSTPTFAGTSFDNRQAFVRLIICRKD